jgi:hypothetical protein
MVVAIAAALVAISGRRPSTTNTLSAPTVTTATSVCVQGGPIGALRIRVVNDNPANTPIEGATISGYVSISCGIESPQTTTIVQVPIANTVTPANGTITNLQPEYDGTHSLTIVYSGMSYHVTLATNPEQITMVTLSIPSGHVNMTSALCYPHYSTLCDQS